MGRELQKKKNRSSLPKVRRKPKSKKLHFNNPTIAKNWDKTKTLTQNYQALGLAVGLNKPTGGSERTIKILEDKKARQGAAGKLAIDSSLPTSVATTEVRVERDPKTGQILRVIEDESERRHTNHLNDPLNDVEDKFDEPMQDSVEQTDLIRELESQAAAGEKKKPRHQSSGEKEWIEALVAKHGDDYEKMWRDRKLNPMQQSVGQIRKKVREWRQKNEV